MFIDFEGIDGSGKTTLSEMLLERMQSLGIAAGHTRAKGQWKARLSGDIRSVTRDPRNIDMSPTSELLLYTARDAQMVEEYIKPALEAGQTVIADRYLYSYHAMCHFGRGLPRAQVDSICDVASRGIWPDLVIYVDVDLPTSRWRKKVAKINDRRLGDSGRKGMSGLGLRQRMREGFLQLAAEDPEHWVVVDNVHDSLKGVFETVWAAVLPQLRDRGLLKQEMSKPVAAEDDAAVVHKATFMEAEMERILALPGAEERRDALEHFYGALLARFRERWPDLAALLLSGLDRENEYHLRETLLASSAPIVMHGLSGLLSEAAWDFRERHGAQEPEYCLLGLKGMDSRMAWALRDAHGDTVPEALALSLAWLDNERANDIRRKLFEDYPLAVLEGSIGVDTTACWELRDRAADAVKLSARPDMAAALARSIRGLANEQSWALRERLKKHGMPWVLESLDGLVDEEAWKLRLHYSQAGAKRVLDGLKGVDDPRAWQLRLDRVLWAKEALDSIVGMDQPEAWHVRDKARGLWDNTLVSSLGGLDSEKAWQWRWELYRENPENLHLIKHLIEAFRPRPLKQENASRLRSEQNTDSGEQG